MLPLLIPYPPVHRHRLGELTETIPAQKQICTLPWQDLQLNGPAHADLPPREFARVELHGVDGHGANVEELEPNIPREDCAVFHNF